MNLMFFTLFFAHFGKSTLGIVTMSFILASFSVVCAGLVLILCVWWRNRRVWKMLNHLPRHPTLPLIGNLHQVWGDAEHFMDYWTTVSKIMDRTKSPFSAWLGPLPFLGFNDQADTKLVATTFAEKPDAYQFANLFGNGLVTAHADVWKHTSRKLSGAFSAGVVAGCQDTFNQQARKLVDQLKTEAGKEPFNVRRKYLMWSALETIFRVTFGEPSSSECDVIRQFHRLFSRVLRMYTYRTINILYHSDFIFRFTSVAKYLKEYEHTLNDAVETVITARKNEREQLKIKNNNETFDDCDEENERPRLRTYLDLLLDLSERDPVFTQQHTMAEMHTIIGAGHDTIVSALTMALLMVGAYPEVQTKLHDEMKEIFGDTKRPITREDLTRMTYCEAVINETLRLYPPVPVCFRSADHDLKLEKCTAPKGVICAINIWGAGRSQHGWGPDVDVFRPERWLETTDTPFFIPFSYGKRACIGKRYSMAMLKTTIAECVRQLQLKADVRALRVRNEVVLTPFAGNLLQVTLRQ